MRIKTIELGNFRNYLGEHRLDLNINGNQGNILFIGGENGAGKTSIFRGVKTCLFGKNQNGRTLSKKEYQDYLYTLTNKKIRDDGAQSYVRMSIELDDIYPHLSLSLERNWETKDGELVKEEFQIRKENGEPLELVPKEYWQDYVYSLFPPSISEFFLFSGEDIHATIIRGLDEKILRNFIKNALGLELHERLIEDLENLERQVKRENINLDSKKKELEELEQRLSKQKSELEDLKKQISRKKDGLSKLKDEKVKAEEKLKREASEVAKEREKIKSKISSLKEKRNSLNKEIEKICESYLPFVIPKNIRKELMNQLEDERKAKREKANRELLGNIKNEAPERIEESKRLTSQFSQEEIELVKNEFFNIIDEMKNRGEKDTKVLLHDLTEPQSSELKQKLRSSTRISKEELPTLLEEKDKLSLRLKKYKRKLKKIPSRIFVKDSIEKISEIKSNIDSLGGQIDSLKERKNELEEDIEETEIELSELEDTIYAGKEAEKKIEISSRIRKAEEEFLNKTIQSRVISLEKIMTDSYRKLSNKEDMVEKIEIDKETFSVNLIDSKGNSVEKEDISTGEREIFSITLLWSLAEISDYQLPMVMDAPLSNLGETHTKNIVKHFFPNAGDQVVVLTTRSDIDRELYEELEPRIYRAYSLSLESKNKIHEGYFPEQVNNHAS